MTSHLDITATLTTTGTVTPPIGPVPPGTAAALWTAIDAYGCDAALHGALGRDATTRAAIDRAITTHVKAEVARRLAAAPDVEAAIATLRRLTFDAAITGITIGGVNETIDRLRAAIAADKVRAVEEATAVTNSLEAIRVENGWPEMAPVDVLSRVLAQRAAYYGFMRDAQRQAARPTHATSPAMVEAYKAGCEREAARRRAAGNCSYRPEDIIAAGLAAVLDAARPTPDEARRLVELLRLDLLSIADTVAALHGAVGPGLRGHCVAAADRLRTAADATSTALLRALGVEA